MTIGAEHRIYTGKDLRNPNHTLVGVITDQYTNSTFNEATHMVLVMLTPLTEVEPDTDIYMAYINEQGAGRRTENRSPIVTPLTMPLTWQSLLHQLEVDESEVGSLMPYDPERHVSARVFPPTLSWWFGKYVLQPPRKS